MNELHVYIAELSWCIVGGMFPVCLCVFADNCVFGEGVLRVCDLSIQIKTNQFEPLITKSRGFKQELKCVKV